MGGYRELGASKDDEHPHHRRNRAADSGDRGAGAHGRLGQLATTTWFLLTLASFPFVATYLGALILRGDRRPVSRSLLGGVILIAALHIPWLNIVAWLLMVFFGLGAQLHEIHRQRPWHDTETSTTRPAQEGAPPANITR